MKIAVCISGDLRGRVHLPSFEGQHQIDIFLSTWGDPISIPPSFPICTISRFEKRNNYFLQRYRSSLWMKYPSLSGPTTCGNAVSMWYQVKQAFDLCDGYAIDHEEKYDVVVRTRPDILLHRKISLEELESASKVLMMPAFHGKYKEVTYGMMDHFFLGPMNIMRDICSLYDTIDLTDESIQHTAEGFLFKACEGIHLQRFEISYDVWRPLKNTYEGVYP